MGCIVSCFRGRDRERNLRSRPRARSNSNPYYNLERLEERLVVDNQLGSLFIKEEENCDLSPTLCEELRLEAKHLKHCGAIPETPWELCKSNNRVALRELNGTNQSSNSSHTTSSKKIQLFAQCEQESSPDQPIVGAPNLWKEYPISRQNTPATGSADGKRGNKLNLTPVRYRMGIQAQDPNSPYPTPVTLTDDMQTPATIYSSYAETSVTGKRRPRIRAQYAYPALEPAQRFEVSTVKLSESGKENELAGSHSEETPKLLVSGKAPNSCEETPEVLVPTLSEWLKPTSSLRRRTGIPNTTNKYKEDLQATWETIPFEERLDRF